MCLTTNWNLPNLVILNPRLCLVRLEFHKRRTSGDHFSNAFTPIGTHSIYYCEGSGAEYIYLDSKLLIRWVSVVEFHDPTLIIGKVFGQESTVVKWNYQILGLHPVAVRQKLGVILVIKWFKNWSQQKMLFTKKVRLNWYSSMNFFLERFGWFLT